MKLRQNISPKTKKAIAVLLLLYFVLSPLLLAFPVDNCGGACMIDSESHSCTLFHHMQNDCCKSDLIDQNNNACNMELTPDNCNMNNDFAVANDYVVTPKFNSDQNFIVISTISLNEEKEKTEQIIFKTSTTFALHEKLPIFKIVQSFLN